METETCLEPNPVAIDMQVHRWGPLFECFGRAEADGWESWTHFELRRFMHGPGGCYHRTTHGQQTVVFSGHAIPRMFERGIGGEDVLASDAAAVCIVITVYEPTLERWSQDFRTRKMK